MEISDLELIDILPDSIEKTYWSNDAIKVFREWLVEQMNRADDSYNDSYEGCFAGEAGAFEDAIKKLDETFK